jgi:hypothetical protein
MKSERVQVIHVDTISKIQSPYASDAELAKYFCKSKRATQDFLREMEKEPGAGKWIIHFGGRCTHIRAAIAFDQWRHTNSGMARPPKFEYKE